MRNWKVGTLTAGLLLVFLGIVWLTNSFWNAPVGMLLSNSWPILLVLLGVEVLFHHFFKREEQLKFDGFSLFLVIILGFASFIIYGLQSSGIMPAISGAINQDVYSKEVQFQSDTSTIEEILIDIPNGDVSITGTDRNEMTVDGMVSITAPDETEASKIVEQNIFMKKIGKKLIFKMEPNENNMFGMNRFDGTFQIQVPENQFINVHLLNGDMDGENLQNGSKIEIVNGDIMLNDVHKEVELENTNGNIHVENWSGPLNASLTNGDIEIITKSLTDEVSLETVNGSVKAIFPIDSQAFITAKSNNGDVVGSVDWVRKHDKENHLYKKEGELTLGKGEHEVSITSVNGDIKVDLQ